MNSWVRIEFVIIVLSWVNLNYLIKPNIWKLHVPFHNLRGYDGHLTVKTLKRKHGKTRVIANNLETYMSFSASQLQFLDLAETLSPGNCNYTSKGFINSSEFALVNKKGVYMYDYMNSMDRFDETSLPSKKHFFNKLTDKHISGKQYKHDQRVWDKFHCKTLEDYHDIYIKSDVRLLADLFDKFRNTCLHNYRLDPVHYYTTPGLAWDAALRMAKVTLELITDIDMYTFIEDSIRGGISMISNRYAKSNNIFQHVLPTRPRKTEIIYFRSRC